MRLAALVEHPDHVCCRYRLRAFEPILRSAGCTIDYVPLTRAWSLVPAAWQTLHRADAVVLQRQFLQGWQRFLLRRATRHLIFDFDDAVFLRDSYSPRGLQSHRRARRKYLMSGRHIEPVRNDGRTTIHCDRIASLQRRSGAWSDNCEARGDDLMAHSEWSRWLGLSLKLICDRFFHLRNMPVIPCPWTAAGEAREIAAADIGISWIPDDDWSRGKCGLKILQYMAAGLPVVANPVGVHRELIVHGETGFLADSPEEWIDAVGRLKHDRDLRRRMGRAGRRRLENHFSVRAGARQWLELLGKLGARKRAA